MIKNDAGVADFFSDFPPQILNKTQTLQTIIYPAHTDEIASESVVRFFII